MTAGCQIPVIDHTALGVSRLATQYRESTNLIGYLSAFLAESDELETTFQELLCNRTIEEATGTTLDHIGTLVGQSRFLKAPTDDVWFGFLGTYNSGGFADSTIPGSGALFRSTSDPEFETIELSDEDYRTYIQARIINNHTSATLQEVVDALRFFLPDSDAITITEQFPAAVAFDFQSSSDEELVAILFLNDLVPRAAGVEYIVTFS